MAIGFIGLGNLGQAITKRLKDMDEEVIIYNRTKEKVQDLGFEIMDTPKDLTARCDTIFMCLFDSQAVKNIFNDI